MTYIQNDVNEIENEYTNELVLNVIEKNQTEVIPKEIKKIFKIVKDRTSMVNLKSSNIKENCEFLGHKTLRHGSNSNISQYKFIQKTINFTRNKNNKY